MERKKKIKTIQISLIIIGFIIIFLTYSNREEPSKKELIVLETAKENKSSNNKDVFFNIEYSGLDLAGNRYILKSKEAYSSQKKQEILNMKTVEATFYFKDQTVLNVWSDNGIYNNKTLDMVFEGNVKATYEGSKLFAHKAEYSNSNGFLSISEKVKIEDIRGTMVADKLLFDIKKQKLDIASFNDGKINANVNLK